MFVARQFPTSVLFVAGPKMNGIIVLLTVLCLVRIANLTKKHIRMFLDVVPACDWTGSTLLSSSPNSVNLVFMSLRPYKDMLLPIISTYNNYEVMSI